MIDVAPQILESVQKSFKTIFDNSIAAEQMYELIKNGTATYKEANDFAIMTGEMLSTAFKNNISVDLLPEGKITKEMAEQIIGIPLQNNYDIISKVCEQTQTALNRKARIGLKGIKPKPNKDRIDGFVKKISEAEKYDDVAWMVEEPVVNFSQSIVDDSIRENAEFQYNSGLTPVIKRTTVGNCCEWCRNRAGTYKYPDVPNEVYQRHRYCRCTVELIKSGRTENAHTKMLTTNLSRAEKIKQLEDMDKLILEENKLKRKKR